MVSKARVLAARTALIAVLIGAVVVGRPRQARAEERLVDGTNAEIAGMVFAATATIGMGIYDLAADDPSRTYGVVEAAVHTPIALVWTAAMIDDLDFNNHWDNGGGKVALPVLAGLNATLAIHGIYTACKSRPSRTEMIEVGSVRANVTLTPVSDGRSFGGGLGLAGTF